jgi:hypothetical protein
MSKLASLALLNILLSHIWFVYHDNMYREVITNTIIVISNCQLFNKLCDKSFLFYAAYIDDINII